MKIRYDTSELVIRNVDEDPPGIVATADVDGELVYGIVGSWQPPAAPEPGTMTRIGMPGVPDDFQQVAVEDLLDACDDLQAAQGIWYMAAMGVHARAETMMGTLDVDGVARALALAARVRDGFKARGWVRQVGPGVNAADRRALVARVDAAIGYTVQSRVDEPAAAEGLTVSRDVAAVEGLGAAAAAYLRRYALFRAGFPAARWPNTGRLSAGEAAILRARVERELAAAGLLT